MVVLVGETSTENVSLLKSTLSDLKKSSFFYIAYMKPGKYQIALFYILSYFWNIDCDDQWVLKT